MLLCDEMHLWCKACQGSTSKDTLRPYPYCTTASPLFNHHQYPNYLRSIASPLETRALASWAHLITERQQTTETWTLSLCSLLRRQEIPHTTMCDWSAWQLTMIPSQTWFQQPPHHFHNKTCWRHLSRPSLRHLKHTMFYFQASAIFSRQSNKYVSSAWRPSTPPITWSHHTITWQCKVGVGGSELGGGRSGVLHANDDDDDVTP